MNTEIVPNQDMESNSLEMFKSEMFEVRAVVINNEPYFVASDVATILGYRMASDLTRRLDDDEKGTHLMRTLGGDQEITVINESGLYSSVLASKKKEAKLFKKWVTSEVLPSIRKHSAYLTDSKIEELLISPDTIINLANQIKQEREEKRIANEKVSVLEHKIEQDRPKLAYATAIEVCDSGILIGNYAKLLSNNSGLTIGQNDLFECLRTLGYLCSAKGEKWNTPNQPYVKSGYFKVLTHPVLNSSNNKQSITTKITGKGQIALQDKVIAYFTKREELKKQAKSA
jgi:anti-repressor protein